MPSFHIFTPPPFLSILFCCKSVNFFHLHAVTLFYGCLILALPQYLPHITPYNILMVYWIRKIAWCKDVIGKITCVVFLSSVGFTWTHKYWVVRFHILESVFQEFLNNLVVVRNNRLNNKLLPVIFSFIKTKSLPDSITLLLSFWLCGKPCT